MKAFVIVTVAALIGVLSGCEIAPDNRATHSAADTLLVRSYADDALRNGIITQHTLYPFHFVANSAELNELGRHDLAILAGHFKRHPGHLNVRRGREDAKLYAQRVQAIVESLKQAGVDAEQMTTGDALPGGEGMSSERVVSILSEKSAGGPGTTTTVHQGPSSTPQE